MPPPVPCPRDSTINRIEQEMWYTNLGKGPVTVRLHTLEGSIERMELAKIEHEKSMERKFNIILAGVIAIFGTIILDLIFKR